MTEIIELICLGAVAIAFVIVIVMSLKSTDTRNIEITLVRYFAMKRSKNTITIPWPMYDDLYRSSSNRVAIGDNDWYLLYRPYIFNAPVYTIIPDRYEDYKKDLELRERERMSEIMKVLNDMKHEIGDVKDEHEI